MQIVRSTGDLCLRGSENKGETTVMKITTKISKEKKKEKEKENRGTKENDKSDRRFDAYNLTGKNWRTRWQAAISSVRVLSPALVRHPPIITEKSAKISKRYGFDNSRARRFLKQSAQ